MKSLKQLVKEFADQGYPNPLIHAECKLWALQNIFFNQNIIKVSSFLNLSPVWNKGISFGMFSNLENINFFITILTLIIISILFFWFFKTVNFIQQVALIFIISGAIGNLIDRFKYNAVVDFIDFHINNLHWPAFNFADTYITIGVIIYIIGMIYQYKNKGNENQAS